MWVLVSVYELNPSAVATTLDMLLNHRDLTVQDSLTVAAALKRLRARSTVSFSACLVLEMARKEGHLPLGTFDRALARVEGAQRL